MSRAIPEKRAIGRVLAPLALLALVASSVALGNHLDPRKSIRLADQSRARAMLLRAADFGPDVRTQPNGQKPHLTCPALNESDLTLTGDADSLSFVSGFTVYSSTAVVYRTAAESRTGWKRSLSRASIKCVEDLYRSEYAKQGLTLESFTKRSFPRVSDDVVAFRAVFAQESQAVTLRVTLDAIGLRHSRASAGFVVGSVVPLAKSEVVRLARLVSQRMVKAMRGA